MSFVSKVLSLFGRSATTSLPVATRDELVAVERAAAMSLSDLAHKMAPGSMLTARQTNRAMWPKWDPEQAVSRGLDLSVWLFRCVDILSKAFADVPLVVGFGSGDEFEPAPTHPAQALLDKPNDFHPQSYFRRVSAEHLLLTGNALICATRGARSEPLELFTIQPNRIAPVADESGIIGYDVRVGGRKNDVRRLSADDVTHIMLPNPDSPWWGHSPLQAVMREVAIDSETANWQKTSLQNMLVPPGVFTTTEKVFLSKTQLEETQDRLRSEYQGSLRARQPMLLGGLEWKPLAMSPQELDFLKSGKINAERICAAYGVPLPLAGIIDKATYNNIRELRSVFWEDTATPFVKYLSDGLAHGLSLTFGEQLTIRPDMSRVEAMLPLIEKKVGICKDLFGMGVPFNRASEFVNLGIDIGAPGDVSMLPANLVSTDANADIEMSQRGDFDVILGGRKQ